MNFKSIFHHPSWFSVLNKTYGFDVKVLGMSGRGVPFVVRNNKYISLPFSDYVKVLITKEEADDILGELIKNNPGVKIEIRDKYEGLGFENKLVGYIHTLSLLKSEEEIFNNFNKSNVIRNIKKAEKSGLHYYFSNQINDLEIFYYLHLLTRKKLGIPIQPKKFFLYLHQAIISKGMGFIEIVKIGEIPIASAIFLGICNRITYKFGASNTKYLEYRPNHLLFWAAIKESKRRGFEIFDFGRTELENEGLRKFKLGWGTKEEPLYYSYYPKAPNDSRFRFIKNKIVAPIIRNSPKFICRLSGELFYKYFG